MKHTKCQWINLTIMCALVCMWPMRAQSSYDGSAQEDKAAQEVASSTKGATQIQLSDSAKISISSLVSILLADETNEFSPEEVFSPIIDNIKEETSSEETNSEKTAPEEASSEETTAEETTSETLLPAPTIEATALLAATPIVEATTEVETTQVEETAPILESAQVEEPTPILETAQVKEPSTLKAEESFLAENVEATEALSQEIAETPQIEDTQSQANETAQTVPIIETTSFPTTTSVTPNTASEVELIAAPTVEEKAAMDAQAIREAQAAITLQEEFITSEQAEYDPVYIIKVIDARMAELDRLIHQQKGGFHTPEFLHWNASYALDTLYFSTLDKIAEAQASIIKTQSGIQLTGQTYYRPDATFGIDEDTDDVSRYVGKIQAEVRWYFLQSGIYNRGGRINEINLKTDIQRLEHLKNRAEPQLYANRERLRINSDSVLASVMLHRMRNLEMLEQAYIYLLDNENISSDNLLRILDDRAEAERRLSTISTSPTFAPTLSYVQAGTITVDTMAIFETIYQTDINLKILDKQSMLLDQQASNQKWLNDVRVAPFVRYSHYFRHNMAVSANVDAGISFTIPINGEASRKRRALLLEKGLIDSKRDEVETGAADRVRYIVNEVYRLNRSITGEWQRAQSLKKYLRSRRAAYDRRQGEYNRLSALMEYNGYLKCLENIIEIQYRRDSLLADLQSLMPETPLDRYCAFTPLLTHE